MIQKTLSVMLAGAAVLLAGCATKSNVNDQVSGVNTRVGGVSERVTDHEGKLANLDRTSREALERAQAAGKLAEGKFLYSEVLSDDSMKFATGKADLSPEATARLDAFIDKLKTDNRNVYVEVQGHTDSTGPKDANYKLGEERADAVRRYLNQHGVALNRIGVISYGADAPAQPNGTKAGRQANRRVVLIVLS